MKSALRPRTSLNMYLMMMGPSRNTTWRAGKWYLEYPGMGKASLPEAIAQSCRYIEANYKSNLSLTEMANLTNFSISHFSALFKTYGRSLVGYVNRLRMDEAKSR